MFSRPSRAMPLAICLLVSACAEARPPGPAPAESLDPRRMRETCPLGVQNAHVTFDETATGAMLAFTTTPDRLDELRARVVKTSELHGTGRHTGEGHDGKHGQGGGMHGLQPYYLPPARVAVVPVENGARLMFTPERFEDIDALRSVLRFRADRTMAHCN
jgi:hypothetical protein